MSTLVDVFTDIGDAIREKENSTGVIPVVDMADRIRAIETCGETTTLTVRWSQGSFSGTIYTSNKATATIVETKLPSNSIVTVQNVAIGDIFVVRTTEELEINDANCVNVDARYASSNSCYAIITGINPTLYLYNP